MRLITGLDRLQISPEGTAVAIGNFDGVHLGHQKILHILTSTSSERSLPAYVLTFYPHPENVLGKHRTKMIQTLRQRTEEIGRFRVDSLVVLPFDKQLSELSAADFLDQILAGSLRAKVIVVGKNFRFGKNREGDLSLLERLSDKAGIRIQSVPPVRRNGEIVSSSLIRSLIQSSDITAANRLLGHHYEIEGRVISGRARGKKLGFPTANILPENEILPYGVFITSTLHRGKAYPSLTNVGRRPTFDERDILIETYLIDFQGDLYEQHVAVRFRKRIRDEMKFLSAEDLAKQIERDLEAAKRDFGPD